MGWDGYTTALQGINRITKNFLDEYFAQSWNPQTHTVLATSYSEGTYYEAVRVKETGQVFATISLIRRDGDELLVKHMSEFSGVSEYNPSKKVLNALTETDDKYALQWRAKCREIQKLSTLKVGDTVQLSQQIEYQDGYESDTFTITRDSNKGKFHFIGENGGHYCAPRRWRQMVIKVVAP